MLGQECLKRRADLLVESCHVGLSARRALLEPNELASIVVPERSPELIESQLRLITPDKASNCRIPWLPSLAARVARTQWHFANCLMSAG
jgi:hypothetical protein